MLFLQGVEGYVKSFHPITYIVLVELEKKQIPDINMIHRGGWICLLAYVHIALVRGEETGNSLVTCTACQSVQAKIDNWSCDINCQVANGNKGRIYLNKFFSR